MRRACNTPALLGLLLTVVPRTPCSMGPLAKLARVTARVVTRRRDSIIRRAFAALDSRHDGRVTRAHFQHHFYKTLQKVVGPPFVFVSAAVTD